MVERLIPLLDARSIARLAQLHQLNVEVLQAASFWKDLVRRTCLYDEVMPQSVFARTSKDWVEEKFDDHQRAINPLTRLLKRMEDPRACLLQLLHVICERYPSVGLRDIDAKPLVFQVSCPCKTSHSVSHLGFLLLEDVEAALGSVDQRVEKVLVEYLQEPWLSALSSRASRQHERWKWWKMVESVDAFRFLCGNQWDLENFLTMVKNCQRMALVVVDIQDDLGAKGWADLAQVFPLLHGVETFHVDREDMLGARRESLRAIWDALHPAPSTFPFPCNDTECLWSVTRVVGVESVSITWQTEEEKEEEWKTLEEILDGTTFNWQKKYNSPPW